MMSSSGRGEQFCWRTRAPPVAVGWDRLDWVGRFVGGQGRVSLSSRHLAGVRIVATIVVASAVAMVAPAATTATMVVIGVTAIVTKLTVETAREAATLVARSVLLVLNNRGLGQTIGRLG